MRADRFLAEALEGMSRREVQRLLEEGRLRVDGRRLRKGEMLTPGREVVVEGLPEPVAGPLAEPGLAVEILHEDEALVAVDKPAGMPSDALRAEDRGTVANFLVAHFPEMPAASEKPLESGLVHRLDTATSGVLVAARSRAAWSALRAQLADRSARKLYRALVAGRVDRPGEIRLPIGPDPRNARRSAVFETPGPGRKSAITRWRPIRPAGPATLLEVEIPTGMRHQIRVHLARAGIPVVGDVLYGGPEAPRLGLHAASIEVVHPTTGRRITIESSPPEGLGD